MVGRGLDGLLDDLARELDQVALDGAAVSLEELLGMVVRHHDADFLHDPQRVFVDGVELVVRDEIEVMSGVIHGRTFPLSPRAGWGFADGI